MSDWTSIIPFIIIIPIAFYTKQVLAGLFIGLLVASYIVNPSILGGMETAVDYIITNMAKENKLLVIGFLYVFTGIVNMIKMTGGIKGFIELSSNKIKNEKQAIFLVWVTVIGTFTSPNLRIVTVAPIMKALQKKMNISKERISFVIEATGLPIIALIPVATAFIGFMTSTIEMSLNNTDTGSDPYLLFIKSIPYNIFALVMIVLAITFSFVKHPNFLGNEKKKNKEKKRIWEDSHSVASKELDSRPVNIFIPIITALILTIGLSWWDGYKKTGSMLDAFIKADVSKAMFIAILLSLLVTFVLLLIEKYPLKKLFNYFFEGGNKLMPAIFLFALVWGLSSATEDLGLSNFVTAALDWIPTNFIPPVIFILGSIMAYFVGSTWGSWGLLMPIGVSLAATSGIYLPLMIGIVFACGVFGGLTSPLSGTTVTMSKIMDMEILAYSRYKLKHSLTGFIIAVILYGVITFVV
ncbi:Na+/H+ antiporter NhaC family protein [Halobacillus amylolyticus]|uniref:Sodium:proton antiporter n=1 Tax=Halobacillus amylolyticus TaxID=2932259 RepID=A0ABY4HH86_9BACI|nr:Na+/H+ antiporter NhaC family protein [Halobacillus amylolyticus]UOR14136.1 sodium:proton antiporter [Halobacillus amylolyticus]